MWLLYNMKALKCITLGASPMCMMWPRMQACAYYYTDMHVRTNTWDTSEGRGFESHLRQLIFLWKKRVVWVLLCCVVLCSWVHHVHVYTYNVHVQGTCKCTCTYMCTCIYMYMHIYTCNTYMYIPVHVCLMLSAIGVATCTEAVYSKEWRCPQVRGAADQVPLSVGSRQQAGQAWSPCQCLLSGVSGWSSPS